MTLSFLDSEDHPACTIPSISWLFDCSEKPTSTDSAHPYPKTRGELDYIMFLIKSGVKTPRRLNG